VNGNQISLLAYEFSRSLAIAPGGDRFILGADWSLRFLDGTGKPLWPKEPAVPGAAWTENIPLDRQLVVAALDDGTLRWYRLRDGAEALARRRASAPFYHQLFGSLIRKKNIPPPMKISRLLMPRVRERMTPSLPSKCGSTEARSTQTIRSFPPPTKDVWAW
jgi:hypothetical protein